MLHETLVNQTIIYVAEYEDEKIIGYIIGGKNRYIEKFPEYEGELYAIYLLEEYQGKGVGRSLVCELVGGLKEQEIRTMIVQVLKENSSKLFYQRLGAICIDEVYLEISNKKLVEKVYGWKQLNM